MSVWRAGVLLLSAILIVSSWAAAAESEPPPSSKPAAAEWPMLGGTIHRNMVNPRTQLALEFEPAEKADQGQNLLWTAALGTQTYGNPVVAGGKVFIATNNGAEYRRQHKGDRGVLLCFDAKDGKFLWQLTREKLAEGRAADWPEVGICSTPAVEGRRLWVVTNRCELVCLDTEGFADGKNDGPFQDEVDKEPQDADIVWNLDMIKKLGVFPHNMAASAPVVYGDLVYVLTGNGVDERHKELPAPKAPSFIAVNKLTGEVVWSSNAPGDKVMHGQWSSPTIGVVAGQPQVYFPGGDGWLYAFAAKTGELLWKFDLNPKDATWDETGRGTRNSIIATPVFFENSVLLAVGEDPEFGEGVGHLYRIDATKRGDVSPATPENQPNPNSAQIWHYGGVDKAGTVTKKNDSIFRRTLSTVAVQDGFVYAADMSGRVHCVDYQTGKRYWEADVMATVWSSTLAVAGKVLICDEDGVMTVFTAGKQLKKLKEIRFPASIYGTPAIAQGVLYVADRTRLYAFQIE